MPILLKSKNKNSAGIIVFTHGEALWGVPAKSKKVKKFLLEITKKKEWIFGIHVQGNVDWIGKWQKQNWQQFFMWPNKNQKFLDNIPKEIITNLTCINFYTDNLLKNRIEKKKYDLISITRFTSLKKIQLNIRIYKELLKINPKLKIILVSPIPENQNKFLLDEGIKTLEEFKKIVKNEMTPIQLKQIEFICSPQRYFDRLPLSDDFIYDLISISKNLLLTSHMEGVPRVIVEALNLKTNVIVSSKLVCGTTVYQNDTNSFSYEENEKLDDKLKAENIAKQIHEYLEKGYTYQNKVDSEIFLEKENIPKLKLFFKQIFVKNNISFNDENWCLENLTKRLACHGDTYSLAILNNEKAFFNWFNKISTPDAHLKNEKTLYEEASELDKIKTPFKYISYWLDFIKTKIINKLNYYRKTRPKQND